LEDPVQRLVNALKRLPGVGEKNAVRIAFHLMKNPSPAGRELAEAVTDLTDRSRPCELCFAPSLAERCRLCSDPARDATLLCVVEKVPDMLAIERTGEFKGLYHVLGGALSPLDGVGPDDLRLKELNDRVRSGGIREVIVATNPSSEGETTASYIADMLRDSGVAISRIASGIPMGGEIEYVDRLTISRALSGRRGL
jgi:recombination protein RecR